MRRIAVLVLGTAAVVTSIQAPARAQDACVTVDVTGLVNVTSGKRCAPTPVSTVCGNQSTGAMPYVWVSVTVCYP